MSAKQPRHLNDRCVEDVEHELRYDADGKHEQCYGNHDKFFPSQKIRKCAAIFCKRSAKQRLHRSHKNDGCDEKADDGKPPMAVGVDLRGESYGLLIDSVGEVLKLDKDIELGLERNARASRMKALKSAMMARIMPAAKKPTPYDGP